MLRKLGLPLMCLAMFAIAGGPTVVLQCVAWTSMLWDYSRDASIVEAAEKTFSGKFPCGMCINIADSQKPDPEAPAIPKVDKKSDSFNLAVVAILPPPLSEDFEYPFMGDRHFPGGVTCPLTPPPRAV